MKYPKEYLEEIKLRLKVSQVVGKSVQLKKRGKEFIGLSPFNNEKSPSFTVSDEKGFYHCFSSGEHGNIFDFIMKTKSLGFGEAVKALAADAGMQQYRFTQVDERREKRFKVYKNILKDYSDFFYQEIFKKENFIALDYLRKRGMNKNTIEEFKIGFVPWKNNFYEVLNKTYSHEDIAFTGLYYKHDKTQKYIDRFNSRIIFPISNLSGDTIAFGGRIIKESKLAKYINSPETEFYKKGKILFNLNRAKNNNNDESQVVIVEGYMDVINLYSGGIKNVISNSGTALTESQIELIWKFFANPVLCLDGDKSGQLAATRIAERLFPLIKENNKIYFSILPDGQDPDDYIKLHGKNKFLELLNKKKIIQSYIWDLYSKKVDLKNPFEVSKFEKDIKKLCYSIKDEILRKYILEDFLNRIKELTPNQNFKKNYKIFKRENFKALNETKKIYEQKNNFSRETLKEFSLLYLMIFFPNVAKKKIEEISDCVFTSKENNNLRLEMIKQFANKLTTIEMNEIILTKYKDHIESIKSNASIKIILKKKNEIEIEEILDELISDMKELGHLRKIESVESDLIKKLDENSYLELLKLKSHLNSD